MIMPPTNNKKITPKKPKKYNDTFKDLDEANYRHVTADISLFVRIFEKSDGSCCDVTVISLIKILEGVVVLFVCLSVVRGVRLYSVTRPSGPKGRNESHIL